MVFASSLGLLSTVAILLMVAGISGILDAPVRRRLQHYGQSTISLQTEPEEKTQRSLRPILESLGRFVLRRLSRHWLQSTRQLLLSAGSPYDLSPAEFLGLKALFALLLAGFALIILSSLGSLNPLNGLLALLVSALTSHLGTQLWLLSRMARRRKEIQRQLPTVIDMLVMVLEGGMGLDIALALVCDRYDNTLTRELRRYLSDIRIGRPRREALLAVAERTGLPDVQVVMAAILQADELGVGLAGVLRQQASQARVRRRQLAQEQARQAPIKMMIPLVLFIFPVLFILILGPTMVDLLGSL